jgi:hypothetical protein
MDGGASAEAGDAGVSAVNPSQGCSASAWTGPTGQWVSQPTGCGPGTGIQGTSACQAIPPGGTVPAIATQGSPEYRGWQVYVPANYNPSKPYRVIYGGGDCGSTLSGGTDALPYRALDNGDAILVGLDHDTYPNPGCYDSLDPQSNDFSFFPWLQNQIESQFCVDRNQEFYSGYAGGASLGQQLDCAFPDKLRGVVSVTGCEPGAPGFPGSQPTCVEKPTAAFFVKSINDTDYPYACILPACERVLKQNGCTATTCDPQDRTLTTPYVLPAGTATSRTLAGATCVSFNGCPSSYPVVFCLTVNRAVHGALQYDDSPVDDGVPVALWDFMNRLSPPAPSCPAGLGFENGTCAPCPGGGTQCGDRCGVDLQTDLDNCGVCGHACPSGASCQGGTCVCAGGQTPCSTGCTDLPTDPGNCGACGNTCPLFGTCESGACACPVGQTVCTAAGTSFSLCADLQTDSAECGACNNACPASAPVCRAGVCSPS